MRELIGQNVISGSYWTARNLAQWGAARVRGILLISGASDNPCGK